MSDEDFMQASDEEYDFEYEDDEEEAQDSGSINIENKYYNAKQLKTSDPADAVDEFLAIPALEEEKGEWGFKGLKQVIKLEFKLGRYDKAVEHYTELLTYVKSAVTRNYSEKSIDNMLNFIEKGSLEDAAAARCMEQFYSQTLDSFQATNNERLWLKTNIKLARLLLDRGDYTALTRKLKHMHRACQKDDGSEDSSKGTYLLEIYALEIQMHAATKNNSQLKRLYERALKVRSAVPHPKIQGIIRECGGKMHMSEENWIDAQSDFFESFRNYDEAGDLRRIQVLRYLLLTTMLMKSNINPFDSQETKPYKHDQRIAAMTELVDAYQRDDIQTYESVLHRSGSDLLSDSFIAENIDEVTRNMRTKAVVKLIVPYTRVRLSWIARQLHVTNPEVQDIVSFLIVDGRIQGRIDEQEGILQIDSISSPTNGNGSGSGGEPAGSGSSTSLPDADRTDAIGYYAGSVASLYHAIFREADGLRMSLADSTDQFGDLGSPGDFSLRMDKLSGAGSRRTGRRGKPGFLSSMV